MPPAFPEASTSAIGLDYVNGSPGAFGDDASFGAWPVQNWFDHSNYSPAVDADHTAGMLPGVGGSLLASLALPPLTSEQPFLDLGVPGFNASPGMSTQSLDSHPSVISPDRNDFATSMPAFPSSNLITAEEQEMLINEFFRTMAPTIPVFARGYITKRIAAGEALVDEDFAALVLSMCAVVHIQPLASSELAVEANVERRKRSAEALLDEVTNLRASSNFGERPSLDTVMTSCADFPRSDASESLRSKHSFFLFACLFGLQKFGAAWLRLQEAISLAQLLGIADPKKMEQLDPEEKERRRRAYCSLAITERCTHAPLTCSYLSYDQCAELSRSSSITRSCSKGRSPTHRLAPALLISTKAPTSFCNVTCACSMPLTRLSCCAGTALCVSSTLADLLMSPLMRAQCAGGTNCNALSAQDAIALDDRLAAEAASNDLIDIAADDSSSIQRTDLALTQLWLRNRLWTLCLDHGLVALHPGEQGLDGMIAFHMARQAIDMCQGVQMAHLEALGVGAVRARLPLVLLYAQ